MPEQIYVIYVDYGQQGMEFRSGPPELRRRTGPWGHWYRRVHPRTCSCLRCCERISAGPVEAIPAGHKAGVIYPLF